MLKDFNKISLSEVEERVLKFWENNKIFEKSIKQRSKSKIFSFYDGPPFASGLPHYGHILATTIKDSVTRFWTMMGFKVERRIGWDCHGLPVENLVEKELGLRDKKAIEEYGVEKFNDACRTSVFRYVGEWEKTLRRVGRWADYSKAYATLDNSYMESVWWVFKQLWDKKLVYSDYRVSPYCYRCGTPLSNFEVNQGYKENTIDPAIFVKFKVKSDKFKQPTYFLAWTTTPWTLTANAALAVGRDIDYVEINNLSEFAPSLKIQEREFERGSEGLEVKDSVLTMPVGRFILAKDRLASIFSEHRYSIEKEFKGKDLISLEYEPLYNFFKSDKRVHFVVAADFVSTKDGTGIVHIAPAFGVDDMEVGKKNNLPVILTVDESGRFKKEVGQWQGKLVRQLGQKISEADKEVIEDLKKRKILLRQEEIRHTYPFCWRCDAPLIYYPINSWYIAVSKFKDLLVKNNKKIHWIPEHIKEGRFGKWLSEARDWAVSRNRFWGAALPIWKCGHCDNSFAVGSLKELSDLAVGSGNKYFIARHGESDANALGVLSCLPEKIDIQLTKKGKAQVKKEAIALKNKKIDLIFSSPLVRTKETAQIYAEELKVKVECDERLAEYNFGKFNGRPIEEFESFFGNRIEKYNKKPSEEGETLSEVRARMMSFVLELEKNYKNKNILIVSHGDPLWVLEGAVRGLNDKETLDSGDKFYLKVGTVRQLNFLNLPYDSSGRLDLHKPYVDDFQVNCPKCRKSSKRVSQVFDCWFESGSMPYAQWHYPFENKQLVEKVFPADFIAEGLDQTRGWFYTLHVLASALTTKDVGLGKEKPAFKNVIVNGLVLDERGVKLSKKLRNYIEPEIAFDKYGADAIRYFLLSSTSIGEDYRFSDKAVEDAKRKIIDRLINSYNFYNLYADKNLVKGAIKASSKLDKWIMARFSQTVVVMTEQMKNYQLTEATRSMAVFLDDLSNWFIRRSRKRLQRPESDKDYIQASNILLLILVETSKLMAPFAPFISEAVYKTLTRDRLKESVHLENWPGLENGGWKMKIGDKELIKKMEEIRMLASLTLALRAEKKVKVRQPLKTLKIKSRVLNNNDGELLDILKDEINVKEIMVDSKFVQEVELDFVITPELKAEGNMRDLVRLVQGLRQDAGYMPKDCVQVFIGGNADVKKFLEENLNLFKKEVGAKEVEFKKSDKFDAEINYDFEGQKIWVAVKKI